MGNTGSQVSLVETVIIFVGAWVLVAKWDLFLDNLFYRTFNLDSKNTFHTFVVAMVMTVILVLFVWILNIYTRGQADIIFDNL